jgi:hypothetical protein
MFSNLRIFGKTHKETLLTLVINFSLSKFTQNHIFTKRSILVLTTCIFGILAFKLLPSFDKNWVHADSSMHLICL